MEDKSTKPNQGSISKYRGKLSGIMWALVAIVIIIIALGLFLVLNGHKKSNQVSISNSCVSKTFQVGNSGSCVGDIQNMLNFIETDNLNECAFNGAQSLVVNGNYDTSTKNQVTVVQNWLNCYNKQEGAPSTIDANGIVSRKMWSSLCTYAYIYPKRIGQSTSPFFKVSLAAGKNAGC